MVDFVPNDVCIFEPPSPQFAVDLIEGWTCKFPSSVTEVVAGEVPLFEDERASWAIEQLRGGKVGPALQNMNVLELGPLEGAHSYMLEQAGAEQITSIEANKRLFLKCLITKEILRLRHVNFLLGDFMPWLQKTSERFDLVWATGVLYHMPEPLQLLHAISKVTDRVHIWTQYVDEGDLSAPWAAPIVSKDRVDFMGRSVVHYRRTYADATTLKTYCGGVYTGASWLTKKDIVDQLQVDGFKNISIGFDAPTPNGPSFAVVARK